MKIYFACSIRGGRNDVETYEKLVQFVKNKATVLSEIFADNKLTSHGSSGSSKDIYAKDIGWVNESDAVIAEVTNPSLGVGYEIATAEKLKKPVLALFKDDGSRRLSAIIDGSPKTKVVNYKELKDAFRAVELFISEFDKK